MPLGMLYKVDTSNLPHEGGRGVPVALPLLTSNATAALSSGLTRTSCSTHIREKDGSKAAALKKEERKYG